MKKKTKSLSLISTALAGFALSLGAISGIHNKKASETKALYSPSTHYEVSDTASELTSYYSSASGKTGNDLLSALRSINSSKYHKNFSYSNFGTSSSTSPYVYTDYPIGTTTKDNNGQIRGSEIASFYTKTTATSYNKEHVWPNSKGGNKVEDDILMPRPTISSENSSRGNSNFIEGKNSSSAGWDPYTAGYDKECRGECARIMLYCVVASSQLSLTTGTNSSSSSCGDMNTLIKWHFDYAPSVYEMNRNNGAEYLQGNRNPFVDHPEYVAQIWSNYNSTVASYCTQNSTKYSNWVPGNYCNYGENTPVTPNTGVTISSASQSISVGSSTTLSATSTDSGTITWSTSNSSVASLSSTSSASGANVTVTGVSAGTATITAKRTIGGTVYSQTCTVTVTKAVSSLSKGSTSPTKTTYTAGESFDPTGLTITATYSDSTTGNVTSSVVWSPNPLTVGTTSVTGTFGGKTITISGLTVNQATEPEIIDSNSDLSVGDYVVLRTAAGVGVTGWNNNKDATVSETESEWKKYYVASASSSGFTLKDESSNNFIASPGSDNKFVYGSAATCSTDNDGHLICNNRYLCKNGTNYRFYASVGSYLPFFIYKVPGSSSAKTLSSISVYTSPTKLSYSAGETFDPTGLVINKNFTDNTSETYTYAGHASEFTFSPSLSTALQTSDASVTITYGGKSCSQAITVNAAILSSISTKDQTTEFTIGEEFEYDGVCTATYNNSTTKVVTPTVSTGSLDMNKEGVYEILLSYTESGVTKTTSYSISVTEAPFVNTIENLYSKTAGALGTYQFYGMYMGYTTHTSNNVLYYDIFIGNGDYGIMFFQYSTTEPSYDAYNTGLSVAGGELAIYNNLYEIKSSNTNKATVATISQSEIAQYIAPISTYTVTGNEVGSNETDQKTANRPAMVSGTVASVGGTINGTKNVKVTLTLDNNKTANVYVKANANLDYSKLAEKLVVNNTVSLKGFTSIYSNEYQLINPVVVGDSSTYGYEEFAADILSLTNSICASSGDKETALASVWVNLEINKFSDLSSSAKATLVEYVADEDGDSVAQAMARYDRICQKYASCSNFIGRTSANYLGSAVISIPESNGPSITLIVLVSLLSCTSIGVLLVIKKRKTVR